MVNLKSSFWSLLGGDFITICSRSHFLEFLEWFLQISWLLFAITVEETLLKFRPFLNNNLLYTYKKHQFWGHQKKFQRKHMDIRKLCCLLIMNKSSARVPWEMRLAQDFIFKENWWSIKAKSIWDQLDNPISLSLHELWQTPNVTPKNIKAIACGFCQKRKRCQWKRAFLA